MSKFEGTKPFQLKIKALSLASESKIIRGEEVREIRFARRLRVARHKAERIKKSSSSQQNAEFLEALPDYLRKNEDRRISLRDHRIKDVRKESRSTHLARTFLSGKEYIKAEQIRYSTPDWDRVWEISLKYGHTPKQELSMHFEEWKEVGNKSVEDLEIKAKK